MTSAQPYSFVISVEIGSSFSGYAFSSHKEFVANHLAVGSHVWQASENHRSLKTSSCVLLRPDGQFDSFGYSAEDRYTGLTNEEKHKWYLYRKFNTNYKTRNETSTILDETGKPMLAIDVFTAAIQYLTDHVKDKLRDRLRGIDADRIHLVILDHDLTQETLLRKAAKQAGITYTVTIVCKTDAYMCYFTQSLRCLGRPFRPKMDFLLLNVTGKLVTMKLFDEKTRECKFHQMIEGGSQDVNDRLLDYVLTLLGEKSEQTAEKWKEGIVNLKREIEFQKRSTKKNKLLKSNTINISRESLQGVWDLFVNFSENAEQLKDCMVRITDDQLVLDSNVLTDICVEAAESLAKQIYNVVKIDNQFTISDVIMIGGYSESPFLQNAIQHWFHKSKLHLDSEAMMSELKGAVVYGHTDRHYDPRLKNHVSPGRIKRYLVDLREEKVNMKNLRLMIIGPEGMGKTSLFNRLLRYLRQNKAHSVCGRELNIQRFTINPENLDADEGQEGEDAWTSFLMRKISKASSLDDLSEPMAEERVDIKSKTTRKMMSKTLKLLNRQHSVDTRTSADDNIAWEKLVRVSVWDFGGGKQSFNTNHIFLSSDAIYLLVFKISDQESLQEMLKWIRSMGTYSGEKKSGSFIATPPILLVGTHKDMVTGTEEEVKQKLDELEQKICDMDELVCIKDHIYGIFEVDNFTTDDTCVAELWDAILKMAPAQAQWDKVLPATWLKLENALTKQRRSGINMISVEEIISIAAEMDIQLTSEQLQYFLRYLHFTGGILYFGDPMKTTDSILNRYVILSPSWLISAFDSIVTCPVYAGSRDRRLNFLWKMYTKTAMLDIGFLKELWKHREVDDFLQHLDILLVYMEQVGLIAEPTFLYDHGRSSDESEKYFFVPAMLPSNKKCQLPKDMEHKHAIRPKTLCLVFHDGFLPMQAADKVMAACIANFELRKERGRAILQRNFGVFKVDFQWSLVVSIQDHMIKLTVYKQSPVQRISPGGGLQIRFFIEDTLQKIAELHQYKNLVYQYHLHCKAVCDVAEDATVPKKELEKRGTLPCCVGERQHFLNRKHLDFWFELAQIEKTKEEFAIFDELPSELLEKIPGEIELARLSKFLGRNYQIFFIDLGLRSVEIEQVEMDSQAASLITKFMHMFELWKVKTKEEATVQRILETMIRNDIDFTEFLDTHVYA